MTALPRLDDNEILVGIMHLVAMVSSDGRDGHMGVWPPDNTEAVRRFRSGSGSSPTVCS
jgi:hypothetical protein